MFLIIFEAEHFW